MEQAAEDVMRRHQSGDSTWSELNMTLDDDGRLSFASFRSSPPDLSELSFPRAGELIVEEVCSWGCEQAMRVQDRDWVRDQLSGHTTMERQLEQDLGRIVLDAIEGATDRTARFVVPVGSQEMHVEMSLQPLNPHPPDAGRFVLDLQRQIAEAEERVKNCRRRGRETWERLTLGNNKE